MAAATKVSIDCSLLAHALIGTQSTEEARRAYRALLAEGHELFVTPAVLLEFSSLVLKFRNRGTLNRAEADEAYGQLMDLGATIVPVTATLFDRAWQVANELGQSDTFDALGYAAAEANEAEFWTSDRRFRNAAASRGLPGVVFVP